MNEISDLINCNSHRPWKLPNKKCSYYQEWNNVLFFHWQISPAALSKLIPKELQLDTIDGNAWVSLVAFTMEKIRPIILPSFPFISNFHEINVRTYVTSNNKPGVYFLNIEAEKWISTWLVKTISGLPYEKSIISRTRSTNENILTSRNKIKQYSLDATFTIDQQILNKTEIDKWLTERYCLYQINEGRIYRYEIHHKEWQLNNVKLLNLNIDYKFGDLSLISYPTLQHYSHGVKVLAWEKEYLS